MFFDYQNAAAGAGISEEHLRALSAAIRKEFPNDPMLFELHVLRACLAIRDGALTIEDALKEDPAEAGPRSAAGEEKIPRLP